MDRKMLRNAGLGIGGVCLAGALGLALENRATEPSPAAPPAAVAPAPAPPPAEQIAPPAQAPVADPASAPGPATESTPSGASVSFIVRFEDSHPIGQAQALEAQGRHADAVNAAQRAVRRDRALRGLCFDRFTAGGFETVLASCDAVAPAQQADFARRWSARLSALDGVDYAEPNAIAQPDRGA
ncbi:MAG: hypothetical protein GC189_11695 [Alphaproteobacteria bacterium]|nr:hypothetical protein [Alphaproteobacteria bacterium]